MDDNVIKISITGCALLRKPLNGQIQDTCYAVDILSSVNASILLIGKCLKVLFLSHKPKELVVTQWSIPSYTAPFLPTDTHQGAVQEAEGNPEYPPTWEPWCIFHVIKISLLSIPTYQREETK